MRHVNYTLTAVRINNAKPKAAVMQTDGQFKAFLSDCITRANRQPYLPLARHSVRIRLARSGPSCS